MTNVNENIDRIINSDHHDPFQVLGLHFIQEDSRVAQVRTFQPHAESVQIITGGKKQPMFKVREEGLFEIVLQEFSDPFPYEFEIKYHDGNSYTISDPYRFLPQLGDMDRYLFNSGTHYKLYDKLGAHRTHIENIEGTMFRVWAPSARRVSVVGNFNSWDGRVHQMRSLEKSGIWELFIPGIAEGELYKFEVRTQYRDLLVKADPFQFYGEIRPQTA
ncbi:1,4-alpha-glucan branching enzyme, partial [Thermodesulfobacteriota bacterium]